MFRTTVLLYYYCSTVIWSFLDNNSGALLKLQNILVQKETRTVFFEIKTKRILFLNYLSYINIVISKLV